MKCYIKPVLETEENYVADTAIASSGGAACWLCIGGAITEEAARAAKPGATAVMIMPGSCGNGDMVCSEVIN